MKTLVMAGTRGREMAGWGSGKMGSEVKGEAYNLDVERLAVGISTSL
ncbi:hypothetical protein [Nostoc punctiforme]|nr:hypothetical protein [Nostoc punctiforme]